MIEFALIHYGMVSGTRKLFYKNHADGYASFVTWHWLTSAIDDLKRESRSPSWS